MEVIIRSKGELISKLEQVRLRGDGPQPYLAARIDIVSLDPCIFSPTQRYVLTKELNKIQDLRWDLLENNGIDILNLQGYIKCSYKEVVKEGDTPHNYVIDVIPPVVEEYFDDKGRLHLVISDGQHRCFLARQMNSLINVAYVRGIRSGLEYYAHPLPNGWDDVEIRDDIPEKYIKKFHTVKDYKARFRDYNTRFNNIGTNRPRDLTY